ncbi:MAG TPA: metallophosphoesterase [Pyrinomonadaceae bacterium]
MKILFLLTFNQMKSLSKVHQVVILSALVLLWPALTHAQSTSFVQITDPHLFDPGDDGVQNRAALAACVKALNDRMKEGADYKFAVITGDIGIENLVSQVVDSGSKKRVHEDPITTDQRLEEGASQLASILAPTKIGLWFFVAGNNDLFVEGPNLTDYKNFLVKLQTKLSGLKIRDLSENAGDPKESAFSGFKIIGFNNASFKNNNDICRLWENRITQRSYVENVIQQLQPTGQQALIFYHIPEVDDPHIVLNADAKTLNDREIISGSCANQKDFKDWFKAWKSTDSNGYRYSSWFVHPDVVRAWKEKVVRNPKILGLFAGHLHDWRRENYSGSISKLHVCPPLAVKLQDKQPGQARGFQEVAVDVSGRINRTVFWYDAANNTFDTTPTRKSNELELAALYEAQQQWAEAENYYREAAAKAETSAVREAGLAGLRRVKYPNHPWVNSALAWTDPALLAPFVLRPLALILFVLILGILVIAIQEGSSELVISAFDGDEGMSKRLATGFPAVKAKVKRLLDSPNRIFVPQGVLNAFPFVSPRLNQFFPQDAFEVAGVKIPNLNVLVKWIVRPRVHVDGGAVSHKTYTFVYAEVWRRRLWFGSRLAFVVTREIPIGTTNSEEFENFIYEVYLKGYAAATRTH